MEEGKLPTEIAQEPLEEARLSQGDEINSPSMGPVKRRKITFAEANQSTEISSQTSSSTYKDILSQPAPSLTHRQRLQWLQRRRAPGLWAQCDDCDRWRFLPHVVDAHELPNQWRCRMNPDKSAADCSVAEAPLRLREEEDLIHGSYSAGSLVWARLAGWPWWPALVDDCPDTEQYYWLDGFSDIPTHYNVVFFDAFDVTRAWIAPENLKPYATNKKIIKLSKDKRYRKRLEIAVTQADDADKLTLGKRLEKYSFIARYPGTINEPKNISKHELKKFQQKLKRKYNIDFPDESCDEDVPIEREETTTVIRKGENMLLVGTPKSKEKKKRKANNGNTKAHGKPKPVKELSKDINFPGIDIDSDVEDETIENNINNDSENIKQPDSLLAQVGSNVTSTVADVSVATYDNDTSVTYVPDKETMSESIRDTSKEKRAFSPNSDDFDF